MRYGVAQSSQRIERGVNEPLHDTQTLRPAATPPKRSAGRLRDQLGDWGARSNPAALRRVRPVLDLWLMCKARDVPSFSVLAHTRCGAVFVARITRDLRLLAAWHL
jgi:hypothetical protein